MSIKQSVSVALVVAVAGCFAGCGASEDDLLETRSSALTTTTSRLVVPAYFTDETSWAPLESGPTALPAGSIVIAAGPGSTFNQSLYQHLSTLKARGVIVLGYVNVRPDLIDNADNDLWIWSWFYGGGANTYGQPGVYGPPVVDGIFFDDPARLSDYDLRRLLYFAHRGQANVYVPFASNPGYVMFNYGTAFAERVATDCLIQASQAAGDASRAFFVTREANEATYLTASETTAWSSSSWNWVNAFKPDHFAHILHDASLTTSTTLDALQRARARNAAYVYLTEWTTGPTINTYGQLPASSLWSDQFNNTNIVAGDFGGSASDTFSVTCPAACDEAESCWCDHDLCQTGGPVSATCSPCAATVCSHDSWCCTNGWDDMCLSELHMYCESSYCR